MISPAEMSPTDFKAMCNRSHAKRRASERFGLDFDDEAFAEFESIIRAGQSEDCRPLKPDLYHEHRTLYAVRLGGKWYPVVFDAATDSVITFPPEHALWPYYSTLMPVVKTVARAQPKRADVVSTPIDLSGVPANLIFDGIPDIAVLPESPTVADLTAAMSAVTIRKQIVTARIADTTKADRTRKPLVDEHDRLIAIGRELKSRRKALNIANHQRINVAKAGIPPVICDDPVSLLMAALGCMRSMGSRLNWEFTEGESAVQNAIETYLVLHAENHATEAG